MGGRSVFSVWNVWTYVTYVTGLGDFRTSFARQTLLVGAGALLSSVALLALFARLFGLRYERRVPVS